VSRPVRKIAESGC